MALRESPLWLADLDERLAALPELSALAGSRVLVTGSTGLIGSTLVDLLLRWNQSHQTKIRVLAAGRDRARTLDRFAPYSAGEDLQFQPYDAAAPGEALPPCDYLIHAASNASPALVLRRPVETMLSNILGLKALLDHARACGAKRVLYVSSSEVYGKKEDGLPYREEESGYVALDHVRSAYPMAKRAAETLCAAHAAEQGGDTVIVRPGHIYGPTASPTDDRVSSAWAWDAARGRDIVMKSDGRQLRSYCYCPDAAAALLTVLLRGECLQAYNIADPRTTLSIAQMAELLSRAGGVALKRERASAAETGAFNPMDSSALDAGRLTALGWRAVFDAEEGFAHTVAVLRDILEQEGV